MVSDDAINYAKGNLRAGPSQWKKMYKTGAGLAFLTNVALAHLNLVPLLYNSSSETAIIPYLVELVNAAIPLVALAFARPEKAVMTAAMYVIFGLGYWTVKYDMNTPGGLGGRGR
jgi:hypothetical protein